MSTENPPRPPAEENHLEEEEEDNDNDTTATTTTTSSEIKEMIWKEGFVPETSASLFSRLLFLWMRPMFRRAAYLHRHDKALQQNDLLPLPEFDKGAQIGPAFEAAWQEEMKQHAKRTESNVSTTKHIRKTLWAVVGRRLFLAGFVRFFNTSLQFAFPLLLSAILKFIEDVQAGNITQEDSSATRNRGYWLSAILFCVMVCKAVCENLYLYMVYRAGYQVRVAVSVAVYDKSLKLASSERQGTTLGELVNLMQVDATKMEMFVPQFHVLWDGLLQIGGYMTILYTLIGWPCFAGLAVMVLSAPLQGKIMGRLYGINRSMAKSTDERVKTTNEALQGMQCVKMYTWEESFSRSIGKFRTSELGLIQGAAHLRGFSRAYMEALPGIVAVTSFIVYALGRSGITIEASTLFAALVAFDQLRFPLLFYPMTLAQLAQAHVSAIRVEKFLKGKEIGGASEKVVERGMYTRDSEQTNGEIHVENATMYWSDPSVPIPKKQDKDEYSDTKSVKSTKSSKSANSIKTDHDDEESSVLEEVPKIYPKAILRDVTLNVSRGELCAVVGRVGCGKSTLCSAVLNETVLGSGSISLHGKVAYAAQSPWVLNATLQDNILFGQPMDEERYQAVIKACQLEHDLSLLDHGDQTEIGERGINLSGGQKQRVSVARAAYSNADIVILDDPLSALDPEVGSRLFEECILNYMKDKTRLLVTNQLQCLRYCDTVVALGDGKVIEQGTFEDLSSTDGGEVQRLMNDLNSDNAKREKKKTKESSEGKEAEDDETKKVTTPGNQSEKGSKALVTEEERNIGAVSISVYGKYFRAGGGWCRFALVYFGYILCAANGLMNGVWVSLWTSDPNYERRSQSFYLGLYGMTAVTLGIFTYIRTINLANFGVKAAGKLHKNLLTSVLHAPMSFFDTTPTGRIISRFSKDTHSVDQELHEYLDFFLFCSITVLVAIGTILFVTPLFGIAILPLLFVYFKVLNYFREVSRETKRLESISRSPVFAHFSETLGGLSTIRAYDQSSRFIDDFEGLVDQNTRAYYCNKSADRWLAVRLETVGATIAGLAGVFSAQVVISGAASGSSSDSNFASLAGLSLTYAMSITSLMNFCVRIFAQLEAAMNSCERVLYYTESIPQEAPFTSKELEDHVSSISTDDDDSNSALVPSDVAVKANGGKAVETTSAWPEKGAITLHKLFMRYRVDTPLVLKGLEVAIGGGERIGVVGRTGSGKSSLLLCLLRMVEPALTELTGGYEAPITIDGVDVLRIGLYDLRSKLGIIPQNPVLFSGTIRSNIDPFDKYTDDEIWSALDQCGMKKAVEAMPDLLLAPVAEYGDNLSQGQRQLLCLGRALLKQCRILLLDEATSSVDFETDREIQRTLRRAFPSSTVLTIAHRVNTIMDSDKILVMKDGLAHEFAPPQQLLQRQDSVFSQIVHHAETEG